jgi:transcriptional regulator with XRE-family HTH domain
MATEIRVALGKKIKALRRARGWRQIDLAAHAELSKTHICDLEVGRREIGLLALERIADALEVKPSELLQGIGR